MATQQNSFNAILQALASITPTVTQMGPMPTAGTFGRGGTTGGVSGRTSQKQSPVMQPAPAQIPATSMPQQPGMPMPPGMPQPPPQGQPPQPPQGQPPQAPMSQQIADLHNQAIADRGSAVNRITQPQAPAVGAAPSGPSQQSVQGGAPPQNAPDELKEAYEELFQATQYYANTQDHGNLGLFEIPFDKAREKKAIKRLSEAQSNYQKLLTAQQLPGRQQQFMDVYDLMKDKVGPQRAKLYARQAVQNEDAYNTAMDVLKSYDSITTQGKSREERIDWMLSPEGNAFMQLAGWNDAEKGVFANTGEQISRAGTVYNIPKDYYPIDPNDPAKGVDVIPGSETDRKMKAERAKLEIRWRNTVMNAGNTIQAVDRALEANGIFTSGFIGNLAKRVAGLPAADMEAYLKTIKANVGFDRLREMREASATGGALGNVSNIEVELLYNSLAALEQGMSPEALEESLKTIRNSYMRLHEYSKNADFYDQMSPTEYYDYWHRNGMAPVFNGMSAADLKGTIRAGNADPNQITSYEQLKEAMKGNN